MKPLSTLMSPLRSVDIKTKEAITGAVVRSDVCAVPAAGVVAESMVCFVLADALLEKFGRDSLSDIKMAYEANLRRIKEMESPAESLPWLVLLLCLQRPHRPPG